jgi:hypothetical protein
MAKRRHSRPRRRKAVRPEVDVLVTEGSLGKRLTRLGQIAGQVGTETPPTVVVFEWPCGDPAWQLSEHYSVCILWPGHTDEERLAVVERMRRDPKWQIPPRTTEIPPSTEKEVVLRLGSVLRPFVPT